MTMAASNRGRLFFLDMGRSKHKSDDYQGRILSCKTDGTDMKTVVSGIKHVPDGITIDHDRKHIWWTNMGDGDANDGSIHRCDLSGDNIVTIVPTGTTGVHTPKQCIIAPKSNKLYWCDREGMRVMRANLDGKPFHLMAINMAADKQQAVISRR